MSWASQPPRLSGEKSRHHTFDPRDEDEFRDVFLCYHKELCRFASQYVDTGDQARDVVQEVFLRIWERREVIVFETSPRAYLYRAVRNQAINAANARDRRRWSPWGEGEHPMSPSRSDDSLLLSDLERRLQRAIECLPERQRVAFTLHRNHDLSYKEIAVVLGISVKTAENHIGRALLRLRDLLHSDA